jgi:hypothetical protein
VVLAGDNSIGEFYSVALTNNYQQADTGTKARARRDTGVFCCCSVAPLLRGLLRRLSRSFLLPILLYHHHHHHYQQEQQQQQQLYVRVGCHGCFVQEEKV